MKILRKLREEKGLTLRDVSSAINVTTSYISQIERGLKEPSLEVLRALSDYLGVSTSLLLESPDAPSFDDDTAADSFVLRKEDRRPVKLKTAENCVLKSLVPPKGKHGLRAFHATLNPGEHSSGHQVIHPSPEFVYVLSGSLSAHIGEKHMELNTDDTLYVDSMIPHDYINESDTVTEVLFVLND